MKMYKNEVLEGLIETLYKQTNPYWDEKFAPPPTYEYRDFESQVSKAGKIKKTDSYDTTFFAIIAAGIGLILATKV